MIAVLIFFHFDKCVFGPLRGYSKDVRGVADQY